MTHASGESADTLIGALRQLGAAGNGGADFDTVRRLAQRRRDRRAWSGAMAGVVGLVAAVAIGPRWGLSGTTAAAGHPQEVITTTLGAPGCPQEFLRSGGAGWTAAATGTAADGVTAVLAVPSVAASTLQDVALVPSGSPRAAILCRYQRSAVPATWPPDPLAAKAVFPLTGGISVTTGLDRLAADLAQVGTVDRRRTCAAMDVPAAPYYLLGLDYPQGRVWVAVADNPFACQLTATNGVVVTAVDLGPGMTDMYAAGTWTGFGPSRTGDDDCASSATGRVGGSESLVPGDPQWVVVCRQSPDGSQTHVSLTPRQADGILRALRGLSTRATDGAACPPTSGGGESYAVLAHYAAGPVATVRLEPACGDLVLGDVLQGSDPTTTVQAAITAAAGW